MTKKNTGQHIMSNAELKASMEKEGLSLPKSGFRSIEPVDQDHAIVLEDLARRIDDE